MNDGVVLKEDLDAAQAALWAEVVCPCENATDRLRELIGEGAEPGCLVQQHTWLVTSAVHLAARTGQACWVRAFGELGYELDQVDAKGKTPAALAVINQRADVLQALHDGGVNVAGEYYGVGQGTLLMDAVGFSRSVDVCRLLLELGVDVNAIDSCGNTAAHLATDNPENMLVLLASPGVDLARANFQGDTAAHIACRSGDPLVIVHLLDLDVDIDCANLDGVTARDSLLEIDGRAETDVVRSALAAHSARQAIRELSISPQVKP